MTHRLFFTAGLLCVVLIPVDGRADDFVLSDVTMTAFSSFVSQRVPKVTDAETKVAPRSEILTAAQTLVTAGQPYPNQPNSVGSGFASSTATAAGVFGVGVNGFFLQNSLPPNVFEASGTWTQTLTNTSTQTLPTSATFIIPAPEIHFFGVGNSFPAGANPDLDASATVQIKLISTLTRVSGTKDEVVHFDYGMRAERDRNSGLLLASPFADAVGQITRADDFDGGFGFFLPLLTAVDFAFREVGPGESLEFGYEYLATSSTGFGETAVLAAIGDPFNLTAGGGRFEIKVGDGLPPTTPPTPTTVPEPASLTLLGAGCIALRTLLARRRPRVISRC